MLRGQAQLPSFLDAGKGHYVCCCTSNHNFSAPIRFPTSRSDPVLFSSAHGDVITWGINDFGQLGHGDKQTRSAPTFVTILLGSKVFISSVACGEDHTLALSREGHCYSWGSNRCGQLGRSTERGATRADVPQRITSLPNLSLISCGTEHSAALSTDGEFFLYVSCFYVDFDRSGSDFSLMMQVGQQRCRAMRLEFTRFSLCLYTDACSRPRKLWCIVCRVWS